MKPYYSDDLVTIYHGDAEELLSDFVGVADMVFTSPPYNLGDMQGGLANLANGYGSYPDQRDDDDYAAWQRRVLAGCWRSLTETGAIFYNHKPIIRDGVARLPLRLNPDLPLRQIIIWYRQMGVNWAPTHFMPVHEWVMVFAKPGWRLRDKTASHASDVWAIRPDMGDNEHPAPFPLALPARAIASTTAQLVLDPFMGSGTTLRAAKDHGRRAIGVDIDERYCEMAALRCSQEVLGLSA